MKSKRLLVLLSLVISGIIIVVLLLNRDPIFNIPKNIILISMDTTRAGHLSCYGYQDKTTPHIDALAQNALVFEHCFANIPLTLPSHATMLTGLIPPTHGVEDNLFFVLPDSIKTLPETLKENGYRTYGVVSANVLDKKYNLDQGFDVYNDTFEDEIYKAKLVPQRPGDEAAADAIKWLENNKLEKKFMFIHFYDPHSDYNPPAPYDKQFSHPYDGEIAYVDACIGRIVDKLKSLGQYDDSLIIITGDHAELLGEHGEPEHDFFIYHNVLRVPLIIKPAAHITGLRVSDNTSLADIAPTIMAQAHIDIPDTIEGIDLSDYFTVENHRISDRVIFNECLTATKYKGNSLLGVIYNQWHYIQTTRPELYNHIDDPQELNDLIDQEPKRARMLQEELQHILESYSQSRKDSSMAPGDRRALLSLGYTSGVIDTEFTFDNTRQDPKDLIALHVDVHLAAKLNHQNQYDQCIALCNKIIAIRSDLPPIYDILADTYTKRKDYDKAIEVMQQKLTVMPDDVGTLLFLTQNYHKIGDQPRAIQYLDELYHLIMTTRPDTPQIYEELAITYMQIEAYDKVIEVTRQKLTLLPNDVAALMLLAKAYNHTGDYSRAIHYLKTALPHNLANGDAYTKLADLYVKTKSYDDAIAILQKRQVLFPDDLDTLKNLIKLYRFIKDDDNAIATIEIVINIEPDVAQTYFHRAEIYQQAKEPEKALQSYLKTLQIKPDHLPARLSAGNLYNITGNLKHAVAHYEIALEQSPDLAKIHNAVAWIRATQKGVDLYNPQLALVHAQKAVALSKEAGSPEHRGYPYFLDTLAVAQSANGDFPAAIDSATLAISLLQKENDSSTASEVTKHLNLFKQGNVYRE